MPSRGKSKVQIVDMEVDHVEALRAAIDLIQHDDVVGQRIPAAGVQPQRPFARRYQLRVSHRVAAGEQSNLVSLPDQLFGQVRNYSLGSSIEKRWCAFI